MTDNKYENLPGIDRSQPDVYETSDLPEDDQQMNKTVPEEPSDSIERLDVTASEAFQSFKGKKIETGNADFSDQIGRPRHTGFHIPRSEFEILGEGAGVKETPDQRFQRLQHEIRELAEDISLIKENISAEGGMTAQNLSAVALTRQVEYLQQQMTDLGLDRQLEGAGVNLADPQGALQKRLMMELDGFKSVPAKSSGDKAKPAAATGAAAADGDHVTYQLYYRPEQAKFSNTARVAELEQRLERLESLMGNSPEKITALNADLATKSLLMAISTLAARTKLLDPSHLDQVEARLGAVQQRLAQVAERKDAIEVQTGKSTKISELYDIVKKWEPMAESLPHIVDRLTALQQLHEQAMQFSQALTHLETAQNQINTHLRSHSDLVKQVQTAFSENMTAVMANSEALGNRVKALNK